MQGFRSTENAGLVCLAAHTPSLNSKSGHVPNCIPRHTPHGRRLDMHNVTRHQRQLVGGSEPTLTSRASFRHESSAQQPMRSTKSTSALHQSRDIRLNPDVYSAGRLLPSQLMSSGEALRSEPRRLSDDLPQHQSLENLLYALDRRYSVFADITYKTSSQRMDVCHRLDNLQYSIARLETSIGDLMKHVIVAKPSTARKRSQSLLKKLESSVHLDTEELRARIKGLNALTAEMRMNERAVEKAEHSFRNAHQAAFTAFRRRKLINVDAIGSDVSLVPTPLRSPVASSAGAIDTVDELEVYYAAVGTLKNMRERIWDLQAEQQEQWERRGLLEDQGHVLEQNDEEFMLAWDKQLEVANKDFEEARTAVEDARKACIQANITIPSWAEVNSVGDELEPGGRDSPIQEAVSPPNSVPAHHLDNFTEQDAISAKERLLHDRGSPLSTPPAYNSLIRDRVDRWMTEIEPQSTNDLCGSPTVPTEGSNAPDITILAVESVKERNSTTSLNRVTGRTKHTFPARAATWPAMSLGGKYSRELDDHVRHTADFLRH